MTPLKPHWVKKDYVSPEDAVLIYYSIDPIDSELQLPRNLQIIKAVDYLGIYEVLMSSKFMRGVRGYIMLQKFIECLSTKGYDIPEHLQPLQRGCKDNESEEEVLDGEEAISDLSSIKLPNLLGEVAIRLMKMVSKQSKFKDKPANEIVQQSDEFKSLRVVVKAIRDGKDYEDVWYQRKTSSVGPFSRK